MFLVLTGPSPSLTIDYAGAEPVRVTLVVSDVEGRLANLWGRLARISAALLGEGRVRP